jgi:hypothetical protein
MKTMHDSGILFDQVPSSETEVGLVNFVDDGPSHMTRIGLAVSEFDSSILSNFNFRNPDSFKLNLLTSGLEEVR